VQGYLGAPEKAVKDFEEILRLNPADPKRYRELLKEAKTAQDKLKP
jgi:hypothetical protein